MRRRRPPCRHGNFSRALRDPAIDDVWQARKPLGSGCCRCILAHRTKAFGAPRFVLLAMRTSAAESVANKNRGWFASVWPLCKLFQSAPEVFKGSRGKRLLAKIVDGDGVEIGQKGLPGLSNAELGDLFDERR